MNLLMIGGEVLPAATFLAIWDAFEKPRILTKIPIGDDHFDGRKWVFLQTPHFGLFWAISQTSYFTQNPTRGPNILRIWVKFSPMPYFFNNSGPSQKTTNRNPIRSVRVAVSVRYRPIARPKWAECPIRSSSGGPRNGDLD